MKNLTIQTLGVAVAVMLWGTASMAATSLVSNQSMSPQEQSNRHSDIAAISPSPLYALSHLDAERLTEQEMTDQELKTVEGGSYSRIAMEYKEVPSRYTYTGVQLYDAFLGAFYVSCGC
jgi:hypothetical protein